MNINFEEISEKAAQEAKQIVSEKLRKGEYNGKSGGLMSYGKMSQSMGENSYVKAGMDFVKTSNMIALKNYHAELIKVLKDQGVNI